MNANDMNCATCADAGLKQKHSWRKTQMKGVLVCNSCLNSTDFRFQHAEIRGGNGWLYLIQKFGKIAFRCRRDRKWAFPDWDKAREYAHAYGQRAYYDDKCGFIHLSSSAIR